MADKPRPVLVSDLPLPVLGPVRNAYNPPPPPQQQYRQQQQQVSSPVRSPAGYQGNNGAAKTAGSSPRQTVVNIPYKFAVNFAAQRAIALDQEQRRVNLIQGRLKVENERRLVEEKRLAEERKAVEELRVVHERLAAEGQKKWREDQRKLAKEQKKLAEERERVEAEKEQIRQFEKQRIIMDEIARNQERLRLEEEERQRAREAARAEEARVIEEHRVKMEEHQRKQQAFYEERQQLIEKERRLQEFLNMQNIPPPPAQPKQNTIFVPSSMMQNLQLNQSYNNNNNCGMASYYNQPNGFGTGFGQFNINPVQATVGFCAPDTAPQKPNFEQPATIPITMKEKSPPREEKIAAPAAEKVPEETQPNQYIGRYKIKIDDDWYTIPGEKIVDVDEEFCSITFCGQSVNVEKSALVKQDDEVEDKKSDIDEGGVETEEGRDSPIQCDYYEVFVNKMWNKVNATDISPSRKQLGTFIVRVHGRSVRVSPTAIRPFHDTQPFRHTRYN
eukprot:sb/3464050/